MRHAAVSVLASKVLLPTLSRPEPLALDAVVFLLQVAIGLGAAVWHRVRRTG
jgi:hypothetical protein